MLSKHGIEIKSAKPRLDSNAQAEMYNGGRCFRDLGHIPYLPKIRGWGITPPAITDTGPGGGAPSAQKFCLFLAKITAL